VEENKKEGAKPKYNYNWSREINKVHNGSELFLIPSGPYHLGFTSTSNDFFIEGIFLRDPKEEIPKLLNFSESSLVEWFKKRAVEIKCPYMIEEQEKILNAKL
jgi:hypothetical protein